MAFAGLLLIVARRHRKRTTETPTVVAVRELEGVADLDRLSAVVRTFLERQYGIPATRLTTVELPGVVGADWRAILTRCDAAKFAGGAVGDEDVRELVAASRALVQETGAAVSAVSR